MGTRGEFINKIAPIAIERWIDGSHIFPSVRIAQNILETGGKIPSTNNLGGIKVGNGKVNKYWDGSNTVLKTWEEYNGVIDKNVMAAFRVYESIYDFYGDQDRLFTENSRYARVIGAKTPEIQCDMLYACGYATDSKYASKLKSLIESNNLKKYDAEAVKMSSRLDELEQKIKSLNTALSSIQESNNSFNSKLESLQGLGRMGEIPSWARDSVKKAVAKKLVDSAENGSYDFYRILTILDRNGLI